MAKQYRTVYPNMRRWSDAKLDKEQTFAEPSRIEGDEGTNAWADAIKAEIARRETLAKVSA